MAAYTSDEILTDAKLRSFYPTSGGVLSDSDCLRLATDELLGIMTAQEMAAVQGLLAVESPVIPLVSGQQRYDLPYRAAGGKIRYACLVDSQGNRYKLAFGRPERFVTSYPISIPAPGVYPMSAWFEDGRIVLYPLPSGSTYSLLLGIYLRPSRLVLAASSTTASATAAVGASTISCASIPSYLNGVTSIDIISSKPPFHVKAYDLAVTALATSGTSVTVTTPGNLLYAVSSGDYITKTEESVVPQIPAELHPLLAARTAKRILQARGDLTNLQAVNADIKELQEQMYEYMSNRNEGQVDTLSWNDLSQPGKSRWGFGMGGF